MKLINSLFLLFSLLVASNLNAQFEPCGVAILPSIKIKSGEVKLKALPFGLPPYTYNWSNGSNKKSITVKNHDGSEYCVTVTDATGCISSTCFINKKDSTAFECETTITSKINLNQNTAKLTARSSSQGPLTYLWSNGSTKKSITVDNKNGEKYCVTITNSQGCVSSDCFTIQNDTFPPFDSCFTFIFPLPDNSGKLTLSAESFTNGNVTYLWSNGSTAKSITVDDNNGEKYCVTVTDATGCISSDCFTTRKDTFPPVDTCVTFIYPQTDSSGKVILSVETFGNSKPTYLWSNGSTASSITVDNKEGDKYCVTVTGETGCKSFDCYTIIKDTFPPVDSCFTFIYWVQDNNPNKLQLAAISSGTATSKLTYKWSNGSTDATIYVDNKEGDKYCVTVTDETGCTSSDCFTIRKDSFPPVDTCISFIYPQIDSSGKVILSVETFGNSKPTYLWSNGSTASSITVDNKEGDKYCVTVTGETGCKSFDCHTIINDTFPPVDSCFTFIYWVQDNNPNKLQLAAISSGTGNLTYNWSNGSTDATIYVDNKGGEKYCVTVTDETGCTSSDCFTLTGVNTDSKEELAVDRFTNSGVKLYPNPVTDELFVEQNAIENTTSQVLLFDVSGKQLLSETYSLSKGYNKKNLNVSSLSSGIYFIHIVTNNTKHISKIVK